MTWPGVGIFLWPSSVSAAALISGARTLAGDETDVLALDFADAYHYASTSQFGSAYILDTVTPANDYDSTPYGKLTYSGPVAAGKMVMGPEGLLRHAAHNLYLNSASPANQSITVVSGATYAITITGSVSITWSGAYTGTTTAGTTTLTAASGTLTGGSTSGSGTVHVRRTPSDSAYLATTAAKFALPYEWGTNLASGTATQSVTVVSGSRYAVYYEGSGSVTMSGAASGACTADTVSHVKATSTTLTLTVTGSVTKLRVRRALGVFPEETRTNIVPAYNTLSTAGAATTTANAAASITGDVNAWKVQGSGVSGAQRTFCSKPSVITATGVVYTYSLYVNSGTGRYIQIINAGDAAYYANFDLAGSGAVGAKGSKVSRSFIKHLGDGWFRVEMTIDGTGTADTTWYVYLQDSASAVFGALSASSDYILIYGLQIEAGAFATSLIPTFGAAATRAADSLTLATSAINWSTGAASIYVKFSPLDVTAERRAIQIDDGTANERITIGSDASANGFSQIVDGGANQLAPLTSGTVATTAFERLSVSIAANDVALVSDGGSEVTDTSVTLPTVTTIRFGTGVSAASPLNGHLAHVMILPRTSTEAQLQGYGA